MFGLASIFYPQLHFEHDKDIAKNVTFVTLANLGNSYLIK